MENKKIILTGDRPTGPLHIGHYVGSLRSRVKIQNSGDYDEMYLFAADAQALTDNFDNPNKVRDNIIVYLDKQDPVSIYDLFEESLNELEEVLKNL